MNNLKRNEMNLIRSRALAVLFSMLVSTLVLLPLFSLAKGGDKPMKNATAYIESLNTVYLTAATLASFDDGIYTLTIENEKGENIYYNEIVHTPERISEVFDLSKLENGNYTLKINSRSEIQIRHFNLNSGKIKAYYKEKDEPEFKSASGKAVFILINSSNIYTFKY